MSSHYKLTIAGTNSLQQGVHKAAISHDSIELVVSKNNKIIKQVNLAADRTSLYRSLEATKAKIDLICQRLGIDEQKLDYDRANLSRFSSIAYKILLLKKMLFEAFIPIQWVIVYKGINDKKWQKIIPDSKVFQADPFIVFKDNKYYIFYEELKFSDYHGYLMVAELDLDKQQLINEKIILKLEHHLSFPNVFEENGTYYMIPECADSHRVDLFECTDFPYQWKKNKTLLDNIQAVDTTPLKTDNGWYLFTSEIVKGADCNDELSIYKSTDLLNKPFSKLYDEPVISDVTNARMAGHIIQRNGELFRVSQNCGKRYGHQANINKIIQIEGGYKEEHLETLKPSVGALGFHTYNQANKIIVGDMEVARFDVYSLKRFVWGNIKKVVFGRK
ncbi:MAG TPA: hypothetical protein EYG68_02810 [Leucothrix mucor]|nr:hypothetical protein [Leucothrix mucor]